MSSIPSLSGGVFPLAQKALAVDSEGAPAAAAPAVGSLRFEDVLLESLEQVNTLDREAQTLAATGLSGGDLTQVETFTAMKKADLAFRTMLQIRNKLVDAYNEVKNMRM